MHRWRSGVFNIGSVENDGTEKEEKVAKSTTVQSNNEEHSCRSVPDNDNDHDVDGSSTQIELCENSTKQTVTRTSGRRDLIEYIQDQRNRK